MDVASHSLVLLQQLNIQREFGFLCDCTVAIGDVYFKAHRAVLAAFSNYFKMIFIHQSSECIKIQPADIQPDIFSYLLHIMYTGKCPKQTVDHGRLEEGIRFLHANHLSRNPNEVGQGFIYDIMPSSNLYGIQISSAQKAKESVVTKEKAAGGLGDKPATQNDHRQFQLSLAIGLEGTSSEHQFSHLPSSAADLIQTAGDASKSTNTIKQEKCDPELPVVPQSSFLPSVEGSVPNCPKVNIKVHTCHYCGEQFNSRSSLLEHVYTHASGSLPFGVPSSILESNDLGEVQPLSEDISPQEGHPALGFRVNDSSQPVEKSLTNNMENLLQVNQQADPVSLMQTEAEPLELNCNYSFSRKRKFACAVCGQKFLQKQQLLEHMYSHTDLSEPESSSSMSSSLQPTEAEEEPPYKKKEVSVFRQEIQQVLHSIPAIEMESSFRDNFPQYDSPALHCHYKCSQTNCETVTLDSKKGDKFAHKWLSDRSVACCKRTGVYWLVFEEGQGMYCFLCRKHNTYNKQNKVKVFNTTPAVRFKKSAIQDHAESQQHMLAILAELASRESHTALMAKEKEEISLLSSAFLTAYWLAKEEIPCTKLVPLLNFLKDPCLQETKYFETMDLVQNIYSCLGIAIQTQLMQTVQQAGCYGLLFGKLINAELVDLLLAFIQYVDPVTAEVKTKFLFAKYVVRNVGQSEADVIVELIQSSIKNLGLSVHKMTSAVTDGADAMTHTTSGVAAQFKEIVPTLISFHSLFPKLNFVAGAGKSSQDQYMEDIEEWMAEIWKLFASSSKLVALYLEELLEMKGLGFMNEKVKEFVHLKLLQVCRARQCSLVASVEGIYNDYSILLKILSDFHNSRTSACNLLSKIQSVVFIGAVYILREVCPILLTLTNIFQKGKVNFTTIESSVNYSVHQLNEIVNNRRPLVKLKNDLMSNGRLGSIKMTLDTRQEGELNCILEAYVSALKKNISNRIDSSLPLLSAFSIFNPLLVPSPDSPNFSEYGQQEVMVLSNHFYRRAEKKDAKIKELKDEWEHFKLDLCNWKNSVPADVLTGSAMTITEWSLKRLFTMKGESGHPYPTMLPFAEMCLSMPVTSMWPKEGLTALRRLEKDCVDQISSELLNSWMQIVINGPEFGIPDCSSIVYGSIKTFMNQRRAQLSSPVKMKSLGRALDTQANDDDTVARCQEFKDVQLEVREVINALGITAGLEESTNLTA